MKRRPLIFSVVVLSLAAAILIRGAAAIRIEEALYRGYPMASPVEQDRRMSNVRADEVKRTEKRLGLLALVALPIGIFLWLPKAKRARDEKEVPPQGG